MRAVRTDYTGYEGKYVALDARTRQVVLAHEDPRVLLREGRLRARPRGFLARGIPGRDHRGGG